MNINHPRPSQSPFRNLLIAAVAVGLFAGCQATGYKKSDLAAGNSQAAAREVQAEGRELDASIAALNDLVNQPATDAKPQFLQFSLALDRLVASSHHADKEVNRIWSKRAAYLALWEKEIPTIQDPSTRTLSETRKNEVSTQFDVANRSYTEAQNTLRPLTAYLQDIRKALSIDLTRNGLNAIKPSVTNANERAQRTQAVLAQAATELDTLSARTASFRVQEVR